MSSDPKKRRKEKYRDLADVELPRFFLIPFLKYLKPHKLRLLAAFFGMFIVGFFGSFTILLLKSPLEILFGLNTREQAEEQVAEALDNGREAIRAAIEDWRARAGGAAQAETLSRLEALEAAIAQREAAALAGPSGEHEVAESFIKRIPGVDRLEDWAEAKFGPAKDALKRRKELWDAWMLEHRLETLWLFAAFISAMAIVKAFFEFLSKYLMAHTLYHAVIKIKEDIFRHVMGLDYAFFVRQTTGFLESRISSDVSKIKDIFDALISDAVQQPITLIFLLGLLMYLSPQLTWITLIGVVFGMVPLVYFAKSIRRVTKKQQRKADELASSTDESLRNFRIVKIFGAEDFEVRKFRDLNNRLFKLFMARRLARFASSPIMEVIGSVAVAVVLVVGGYLVIGTEDSAPMLDPASFLIYLVALSRFYTPMRKLSRLNINWQTARVSAYRILEMLSIEPTVREAANPKPVEGLKEAIEFRNVSFTYGEKRILNNVSLRLERGRTVALVGQSGAGKTTLANLLPRLFDPVEGRILLDGTDLRELDLKGLRKLFGVVTQETVLFNDTVAANIAYAAPAVDEQRLIAAAKAAYAHDFILELDGGLGYKTIIGQAGQQLSGGQRQRLAIARALYFDPEILIFDEATSSLDVESERFVQRAIDNLLANRTALLIAHRLTTIRHADTILVMRDGEIVERGSHEELLGAEGEYHRLFRLALEGDKTAAIPLE